MREEKDLLNVTQKKMGKNEKYFTRKKKKKVNKPIST